MNVSVILPQYNELKNLKRGVLDQVREYMDQNHKEYEVIVSDDGSDDGSIEFSANYCQRYDNFVFQQNRRGGKAHALLKGIQKSKGEVVLLADMDQSTPIYELQKLLDTMKNEEADIVIGSRGGERAKSSVFRKIMSSVFMIIRKSVMLRSIDDTQCGFKLLKAGVAKQIFPILDAVKLKNVHGWVVTVFDVEVLYIAKVAGLKISEVKVEWNDNDISDTKKKKFIKESVQMLKALIRIRLNALRGKYSSIDIT